MDVYLIWVDWQAGAVSLSYRAGFESLPFTSERSRQMNVALLLTEGFRFS